MEVPISTGGFKITPREIGFLKEDTYMYALIVFCIKKKLTGVVLVLLVTFHIPLRSQFVTLNLRCLLFFLFCRFYSKKTHVRVLCDRVTTVKE